MPSRTRSMANLTIVVKGGVGGTLRVHSSVPAPRAGTSSSRPLKRKYSDLTLDFPNKTSRMSPSRRRSSHTPLSIEVPRAISPLQNLSTSADDAETEPPSPVPTEIVDNTPEDYVRTAKANGVKVRDFAYEGPPLSARRVKELWLDPLITLGIHDQHIRRPDDQQSQLSGREMRRLLDHEFVSMEEAEKNWTDVDWERLEEFDNSSHRSYPYSIARARAKPTVALRERVRAALFGYRAEMRDVFVPPNTEELWDGDEEVDEMLEDIKVGRRHGEWKLTCVRPEGMPGPTRSMIEQEEDLQQIFETPVIPVTPPIPSSELPDTTPRSPTIGRRTVLEPFARSSVASTSSDPLPSSSTSNAPFWRPSDDVLPPATLTGADSASYSRAVQDVQELPTAAPISPATSADLQPLLPPAPAPAPAGGPLRRRETYLWC